MATRHALGYSKSTRAKCHGPAPCNGSALPVGTLRYGKTVASEYGENVEWRHWGCVTPAILGQLASVPLQNIVGFQGLTSADQQKIRLAIGLGRVDPADVPESAKTRRPVTSAARLAIGNGSTIASSSSQISNKRKADQLPTSVPSVSSSRIEDDATDEPAAEEPRDELYCSMSTNVVGIQYYSGLVGPGEEVLLVREPQNRYDRNAIQVKNIGQTQVGHLPRKIAENLAPLLDRRAVTVEGVINDGNLSGRSGYTLSITLRIYGSSDKRETLEPSLIWATPGRKGFPRRNQTTGVVRVPVAAPTIATSSSSSSHRAVTQTPTQIEAVQKQHEALQKAAELRQMLSTLEKVDDEGRRSSMLDTLCASDDILNLPLHPDPPGILKGNLKVDLMKHQSQALQWCIDREYPKLPQTEKDKPVQFWVLRKSGGKEYFYNIATKTPQSEPPVLGRGALCADAMGLGKTLTMIALVLATKGDISTNFSKSTLIVAPLSVLSNWEKQIQDHCNSSSLLFCVYYGNNRKSAAELQKYDVVITTYQTVTSEHADSVSGSDGPSRKKKKAEKNLYDVRWKRIILDEGHSIRNAKTKMAQAVVALEAERRWVLSGTPIINSPQDLGSLLTFLRVCRPLDNTDFYKRLLLRPLKNGEMSGVELLKALMNQICIRRTKEMQDSNGQPLIPLPPVEMIKVPVSLSEEARLLYDEVEQVSKQRFEKIMNGGGGASLIQSNVLGMLTRLRQLALHPGLIPLNYMEQLRTADCDNHSSTNSNFTPITPEEKERLQSLLSQAIEDCEECPVCFCILNDPRITRCAHAFCFACISEVIARDPKCPMDRRLITLADLYEPPPPDLTQKPVRAMEDTQATSISARSSAKIEQLVRLLRLNPSTEKSLVFSQFTSFLDKIGEVLEAEGISYVRFDGQMSAKRRQETLARFSIPIEDNVNLLSHEALRRGARTRKAQRIFTDNDIVGDDGGDPDFVMNDDGGELSDFVDDQLKSKGKEKAHSAENLSVMLISLKAGALGLNLTVANNVYLMDPWWQEGIESQAVDRVNRIGQKKPVRVYQLIAEDTVESKVLEIQEKKKKLIQQAFSGIKRKETQRQQREARLQDLVQLFGLQQHPAGN
ncbi:SNF2 family N-terminal domain-containing protein [Cyathus striatus]|nr:SNF2 family N-terminal domain-containing protein [Cyathus striatus]